MYVPGFNAQKPLVVTDYSFGQHSPHCEGLLSLDNEHTVRDYEKMPLRLEPEAIAHVMLTVLERKGRQTKGRP